MTTVLESDTSRPTSRPGHGPVSSSISRPAWKTLIATVTVLDSFPGDYKRFDRDRDREGAGGERDDNR
jgi:hypothetical protein